MERTGGWALALAITLLPAVAVAQARNGNVFNGTAHQPSAGVQSSEQHAGVAPSGTAEQQENHDLGAINNQLLDRAQKEGDATPSSRTNVFGVQPGGVVEVAPNAGMPSGSTGRR